MTGIKKYINTIYIYIYVYIRLTPVFVRKVSHVREDIQVDNWITQTEETDVSHPRPNQQVILMQYKEVFIE